MNRYDPEAAPDPQRWLALDEGERKSLVEQYHRDERVDLPRRARPIHAAIHTIVENQLALGDPPIVGATLERLLQEGLSRHEAIHAIGSVLLGYLNELLRAKAASSESHAPYYAALEKLTAQNWRERQS